MSQADHNISKMSKKKKQDRLDEKEPISAISFLSAFLLPAYLFFKHCKNHVGRAFPDAGKSMHKQRWSKEGKSCSLCLCSKVCRARFLGCHLLTACYSLNKDLKDADLKTSVYEHFLKWGHIMSVKVFKDWLKRPYAFVQYEVCLCNISGFFQSH